MKESKNNIANRNGKTAEICRNCNTVIKHIKVVSNGKAKMKRFCNC